MKKEKIRSGMVESTSFASHVVNVLLGLFLAFVAFCSVVPMWHVVMAAFSDGKSLFAHEGIAFLPVGKATLDGFKLVLKDSAILLSYGVTILYVAATALAGLVLNVLGGYVLSQRSKLRGVLIALMVFSVMFSGGLIPSYMVNMKLGLVGNPLGVILPACTNAMFVIMMMNAFLQVPAATVEAARIDGASHLQVMFLVMLPQARGMALVTMVNTAISAWNDWFSASIYLARQRSLWPLQLVIKDLVARNQDFLNMPNPDYTRYLIQYVAIVIATVPIFLLLPFFIRKLENNMVAGAVKG